MPAFNSNLINERRNTAQRSHFDALAKAIVWLKVHSACWWRSLKLPIANSGRHGPLKCVLLSERQSRSFRVTLSIINDTNGIAIPKGVFRNDCRLLLQTASCLTTL
ncbi:hypothetical protein T01_15109 [Trichinella spiralis]|uniref:Uncharacterized protein n=1 Tax=Trichinella spiralis TaxID=6334 RepID=A0A0V1AZT9_TRISP|nr:hypothetical protein T01_15109 [Trichinella spiralis]